MNFLELVQMAATEAGVSSAAPVNVENQVGERLLFVNYTRRALRYIELKRSEWKWMWRDFSAPLLAGQREFTPAQMGLLDFSSYDRDSMRVYRAADGVSDEQWLVEWDFDIFRDTYLYGNQQTLTGRPVVYAVRPENNAIVVGDIPSEDYVLVGRYHREPQTLTTNVDVPQMPAKYHEAIAYRAALYYGQREAAAEIINHCSREYNLILSEMLRTEIPDVNFQEPLA